MEVMVNISMNVNFKLIVMSYLLIITMNFILIIFIIQLIIAH